MTAHGSLQTVDGRPTVTFERDLPHPVATVWRALTEPEHLAQWFPTTIDGERRAGAHVDFRFRDVGHSDWDFDGAITEFDPPRVFALRWGEQDIRFELTPTDVGARLRFTAAFDEPGIVVRDSSGWHVCVDGLVGHLAGETGTAPGTETTPEIDALVDDYRRRFGEEYAVTTAPPG